MYYDMGFLSSVEVVECSATDLVGEYVGQTGPKTQQLFERALGKVLFVDEAYRLSEGPFAKEAMDELVGILTQEAFAGKLIVILAGYDKEMNALLSVNPGLSSRFPEEIHFENMPPHYCLEVLKKELSKSDIRCEELSARDSDVYNDMIRILHKLSALDSWGNARDIKTLAKQMIRVAYKQVATLPQGELVLSGKAAVTCFSTMLNERLVRASDMPAIPSSINSSLPVRHFDPRLPTLPSISTAHSAKEAASEAAKTAISSPEIAVLGGVDGLTQA